LRIKTSSQFVVTHITCIERKQSAKDDFDDDAFHFRDASSQIIVVVESIVVFQSAFSEEAGRTKDVRACERREKGQFVVGASRDG
jgi:hypothetical protein